MKFRARAASKRSILRLQITSMIDVIFLLLIFFITTTTLARPEAELQPGLQAESAQGGRAADLQPQIVDVEIADGAPAYRLGDRVVRDRPSLSALLERLPKEAGLFVRVHPQVRVGWAVSAVQAGRDAGFERVTYVPADE